MANIIFSILSEYNGKGLAKGKKDLTAFEKQTKALGKTLAKTLGAAALVSFGKRSISAFIDSEKAAAKLRTTVKNLGLEFQQPGIETYLKNLSLQFGIVDENLIPGFQRLLIVTKDVAQAQSLFETALNVAAGTGKDLTTVSTSLSKAYLGDNAALGRLGVGLSKAQLKSASFLEVQRTLNTNFAGQAAAAVEGYAGSMAKLTVAVDESKEAIGKGLLDAIAALSGSNDINTFTIKMVNAAEAIGRAFATVGDVIGLLNPNATVKVGGKFVRKSSLNAQSNAGGYSGIPLQREQTKAIKDSIYYRKQENDLLKKKTAVDQLRDKFDLERIGLTVALNAATDEETKLRLRSQLAILDNNEALAKKLLAEMDGVKATEKLTEALVAVAGAAMDSAAKFKQINPFAGTMYGETGRDPMRGVSDLAALAGVLAGLSSGLGGLTNKNMPQVFPALTPEFYSGQQNATNPFAGTYYGQTGRDPMPIQITVDTSQTGDRFAQLIAESIQVANRSGYSTSAAGQLP